MNKLQYTVDTLTPGKQMINWCSKLNYYMEITAYKNLYPIMVNTYIGNGRKMGSPEFIYNLPPHETEPEILYVANMLKLSCLLVLKCTIASPTCPANIVIT